MLTSRLKRPVRAAVSMLLALSLLASCGGGVDSGGTGCAVAVGPISGFGSIIVNGVRFDVSSPAILIQDDAGNARTRADLQLGTMTEVDGSGLAVNAGVTSAIASSIRIVSDVVGPVGAVDATAGSLTVLGQTVAVTPATAFDARVSGGLGGIAVGTVVQVFGRYDATRQRYTATRIELAANPASYKLRGPVSAIDPKAMTLTLGGQTIDYTQLGAASVANVTVGTLVVARLQIAPTGGVWIAVALQAGALALPDRAAAQVEGRISAWSSSRRFSVDGIPVDASGATFAGSEAAVLLGARVEVEGASSGGVLQARVVKVEGDENEGNSPIKLYGRIDTLDPLASTFTVQGVTVSYAGPVQFDSGGPASLTVGLRVKVEGVLGPDGVRVDALKISFEGG
ncbi:MAG TPA: DUF5666 domain-containing protein [Burkholderiaceae bacterium]